jgi:flagellar P-ring protein precursor FlgI
VSDVINEHVGPGIANVNDPGTVVLTIPDVYRNNVTQLLADIERLPVETDQVAKIVIDEASGTIVMGENVNIDTVAVAQGNLVVRIEEHPLVSQPPPLAPEGAQTVVVPQTEVSVNEKAGSRMAVLNRGANLKDLVAGLNSLGVGPRDLITILQTIKSAGALQAEIRTR